jgi:hypothetical protein
VSPSQTPVFQKACLKAASGRLSIAPQRRLHARHTRSRPIGITRTRGYDSNDAQQRKPFAPAQILAIIA